MKFRFIYVKVNFRAKMKVGNIQADAITNVVLFSKEDNFNLLWPATQIPFFITLFILIFKRSWQICHFLLTNWTNTCALRVHISFTEENLCIWCNTGVLIYRKVKLWSFFLLVGIWILAPFATLLTNSCRRWKSKGTKPKGTGQKGPAKRDQPKGTKTQKGP